MNRKKSAIFAIMLTVFTTFILTSAGSFGQRSDAAPETDNKPADAEYVITIDDGQVLLMNGSDVIKSYNINLSVLPGEDIELLYNGIKVKSISEADLLAEDYDG